MKRFAETFTNSLEQAPVDDLKIGIKSVIPAMKLSQCLIGHT